MIEAAMTLQVFTIVSKVPKSVVSKDPKIENFKNNKVDSDIITSNFIIEGRPVNLWFSLKQRALY